MKKDILYYLGGSMVFFLLVGSLADGGRSLPLFLHTYASLTAAFLLMEYVLRKNKPAWLLALVPIIPVFLGIIGW